MSTDARIGYDVVEQYRERGFVHIPGIITRGEADEFRRAALDASERLKAYSDSPIFTQTVNVWTQDPVMRRLTLHPNVGAAAERLAGVPLRLWHDQILIKQPQKSAPTHFHQDQPYWPHADAPHPISAWIALVDVPVERGCMTFLPGSHRRTDLPAQNLSDAQSFLSLAPDLAWGERVTVPLRAGDCTFHHGRCAHMAAPNLTDEPRVAHVVIFMDANARYDGRAHTVTDPLGLSAGQAFPDDVFPRVQEVL